MAIYRIAHLSDLHISKDQDLGRRKILRELINDLQSILSRQGFSIDGLVVTGDIIDHNDPDNFPAAKQYFNTISEALSLPRNRFAFVPGNHDRLKDDAEPGDPHTTLMSINNDDAYWTRQYEPYFSRFISFVQEFTGDGDYPNGKYGSSVSTIRTHKGAIRFTMLNSALEARGKVKDQGRLIIGQPQYESIFPVLESEKADLELLLVHHPAYWLFFDEKVSFEFHTRHWRPGFFDAILQGHVHNADTYCCGPEEKITVLMTGIGYPDKKESLSRTIISNCRYSVYEFDGDSGMVTAWIRISDRNGDFQPDSSLYDKKWRIGEGVFQMPYRENGSGSGATPCPGESQDSLPPCIPDRPNHPMDDRASMGPPFFAAELQRYSAGFTGREWLFDQIRTWRDNRSGSKILWIMGRPGAGKSAISACLKLHMDRVPAIYFCQYDLDSPNDPSQCFLSLARQLGAAYPEMQAALDRLGDLELQRQEKTGATLMNTLLIQPLARITAPKESAVIVIDALDEAASRGQNNELAELISMKADRFPAWLKIVVTSRREPNLQHLFQGQRGLDLEDCSQETSHDMESYLKRELGAMGWPEATIARALPVIISKSEYLFCYVIFLCRQLSDKKYSLDSLDQLPNGMNGAYWQYFQRQFSSSPAKYAELVRPALNLMAAARDVLPLDLVEGMLGWSRSRQREFFEYCGAVVRLEKGRLHFFHSTVQEWLSDPVRATEAYEADLEEGHKMLAEYGWNLYRSQGFADLPEYMRNHLPAHIAAWKRQWDEGELRKLALDYANNGDDLNRRGYLSLAAASYENCRLIIEALACLVPDNEEYKRNLSISYELLGDIEQARGELELALKYYNDGMQIRESLAGMAPDNAEYRRALGVSCNSIGDIEWARGELDRALKYYKDGMQIAESLARLTPDDAEYKRDLSVSYERLGDIERARGSLELALKYYNEGMQIAESLARLAPDNAQYKRDLSVSYRMLGDIEEARGDLEGALKYYNEGMQISEALARLAPDNAHYKQDLVVIYDRLGGVERIRGEIERALKYFEDAFQIGEALACLAPDNAQYKRYLSISNNRLGVIEQVRGELERALKYYQDGLQITEALARLAPDNAEYQRDLSISYDRLGDIEKARGDLEGALKHYQNGLQIAEALVGLAPDNAEYKRDLSIIYERLGDIEQAQGELEWALNHYQDSLQIGESLVRLAPDNAQYKRDLVVSYVKLGDMEQARGELEWALKYYQDALQIGESLARLAPDNAQYKRDMEIIHRKLQNLEGEQSKGDQS